MTKISYFHAPIRNTVPAGELTVGQIYHLVTADETLRQTTLSLRSAADYKEAKLRTLPFVTPCGTFTRRHADGLTALSGLLPVDIDRLSTLREAENLRDRLFDDDLLTPSLCYVSPSGRGVKAFIPYSLDDYPDLQPREALLEATLFVMAYVRYAYGSCDTSGKDIARCSFLCHDAGAKMRE